MKEEVATQVGEKVKEEIATQKVEEEVAPGVGEKVKESAQTDRGTRKNYIDDHL